MQGWKIFKAIVLTYLGYRILKVVRVNYGRMNEMKRGKIYFDDDEG